LLKGVVPVTAQKVFQHLAANDYEPSSLTSLTNLGAIKEGIMTLVNLVNDIQAMGQSAPAAQIERISKFYAPLLEYNYEDPILRDRIRKDFLKMPYVTLLI